MLISQIKPNPENPRIIKDHKFKQLVESIKSFPQMLDGQQYNKLLIEVTPTSTTHTKVMFLILTSS